MSKINKTYGSLTLAQATDLLAAVGDKVTCLFTGELGIGKSSMLNTLAGRYPDHKPVYLEAQMLDLGDLQMPKFKAIEGKEVVSFVPNEALGVHLGQPIILMLDELGKASKSVLNALLRIMLERKIGEYALPEGSMVFATTNLSIEGLGDSIPPHARNRLCQAKIRKPTAMEWVEGYALNAGVHPVILGAAIEFPAMFQSFEEVEDPNSNHYINHPKQPRTACVTPRSLEKASDILKSTEHLSDEVRIHALMGTVGEAAAMDILTLVKLDEELPTWEQVVKNPDVAKVPKGAAASCMVISKVIQRVEREDFDRAFAYINRLSKEAQALFARSIMRSQKLGIATTNTEFSAWAARNSFLFS
jgi:hypothetical protein